MNLRKLAAAATVGTLALSVATSATAAPMLPAHPAPAAGIADTGGVQTIAYRHWRGGHDWHPGLGRRHGYQYGYRPHHEPKGAAVAASATLGSAVANSRAEASRAEIACSQRHRSYDPRSGTYLGKDGRRHLCR
ncbi:BA14K family protein [Bradyrhizobium sp. HKCCYLS3077]|uniref:BA14K family protein n=1 Tax=Bradyrhizobium sp. HKCCYLS3077 TaxID=3420761 RepID=UPI003EB6A450